METAGQTLSASLAYSANIRRRFVAGCDGYRRRGEGEKMRVRRETRGVAVVGSRAKEEAEERREREAEVRRYRSGVCGRLTRVMAASPGAGRERKEGRQSGRGRRTPAVVRSRGIREREREKERQWRHSGGWRGVEGGGGRRGGRRVGGWPDESGGREG